ncbi:histidine phosphatase family protein [Sphingomonas spermidinifaciens]|uniref:Histidine phosphatase family protein n=1 Tax=Sphingomonas spermidinifaciens TaxID=1141889 RepID=A0A2A4B7V1_9SPHN|nr:histidine phosphatase family protein [Sphingomonas spermidinifaciens]PCD04160.1 histidine phosphatase family protein [Sphingomonas spermidinifaciens]
MPSLTLLRHAKSSWDDAVTRDFDRPLNARGRRAAVVVGSWMKGEGLSFDHVAASPATRVIETLDGVSEGYGRPIEPAWDKRIYLASAATLLDLVREFPAGAAHALMVGHNPGLEDLVLALAADSPDSPLRGEVEIKYPTAAIAVLHWEGGWADACEGGAVLDRFVRPRDLAEGLGPDD